MAHRRSHDEIMSLEYVRLMDIAVLTGSSSHMVGRALEQLKLWEPNDKATRKAFEGGYVRNRHYEGDKCPPQNLWHREKIMALLNTNPWPRYALQTRLSVVDRLREDETQQVNTESTDFGENDQTAL